MSLSRRHLLGLTGVAGAAVLGGCVPSGAPTPTASGMKVTIGLTYIPNIQFAPFYVADASGLYSQAGVQATLRHHGATEALFTALAAGQEQFVLAGADEMLQAVSQGMELVAVAQYYRSYPVALIVKDTSAIKTAADLRGKSVGIPGKFGESWFAFTLLMKTAGLADSDVTVVDTGFTQAAALQAGKVDAIIGYSNNDAVMLNSNGVAVRTIPLVTSGTVPLVSHCLITTRAFLDANPALVKKTVDATTAGFAAVAKDPAGAIATSESYVTTLKSDAAAKASAAKTLDATILLWRNASGVIDPTMDGTQFAAMGSFLFDSGLLAKKVDAAGLVANVARS